jgi:hypothetical protein
MIELSTPRVASYIKYLIIVALVFITGSCLFEPVLTLPLTIAKDFNEGWNAFQTVSAMTDKSLYPDPSSFTANNYPPLSFYIIGGIGFLSHDYILTGRTVALLSLLVVGINIGITVRLLGAPLANAFLSGLLFLAFFSIKFRGFVAMNDPQLLAHALVTLGFIVFLLSNQNNFRLALSSLVMLAGGLVKHSVVPLPLAVTLWLVANDKKRFFIWALFGIVLSASSLATLWGFFGRDFFVDVFWYPRQYHVERALERAGTWTALFAPFLLTSCIGAWLSQDRRSEIICIYVILSGAWGIFISGGTGVDINALFDLLIALSMAAGVALTALSKRFRLNKPQLAILVMVSLTLAIFAGFPHSIGDALDLLIALFMTAGIALTALSKRFGLDKPKLEILVMVSLALPIFAAFPHSVAATLDSTQKMHRSQAVSESDIKYLSDHRGPAMCENLALCYWAGKNFEVDIFGLGQKVLAGAVDEARFAEAIEAKRFALIQLNSSNKRGEPEAECLPQNLVARIRMNYGIDRISGVNGVFLTPLVTSSSMGQPYSIPPEEKSSEHK